MAYFLAVLTITPQSLVRFRAMPKAEQDALDARGLSEWEEWDKRNARFLPDLGGMVGKTLRVSRNGTAPAVNDICGYVVVEADNIEQAASTFEDHPHITTFLGDSIDIMPFLSGPASIVR